MSALVRGDYRLEQRIASVEDVAEATAKLPDESWQTSIAQWMGTHWDVLVDLWTRGDGRSDLVLEAQVYEFDDGYRYEIGIVYVP